MDQCNTLGEVRGTDLIAVPPANPAEIASGLVQLTVRWLNGLGRRTRLLRMLASQNLLE